MSDLFEPENDSLRSLEERILKAVQLVKKLRAENEALLADKAALEERLAGVAGKADQQSEELDQLRRDRKEVRERIERLLGQIDQLNAG